MVSFVSANTIAYTPSSAATIYSNMTDVGNSAFGLIKGEQMNGAVQYKGVEYNKGNTSGDQILSALTPAVSTNSGTADLATAANLKNNISNANVPANYYVENSSSGATTTVVANLKRPTSAVDGTNTNPTFYVTTAYVMKTLMTGSHSSIAVTDGMIMANPIPALSVVPKYLIIGAMNYMVNSANTADQSQMAERISVTSAVANTAYMAQSYGENSAYANDLAGYSSVANAIILGMISTPASTANNLAVGNFTASSINDANVQGETNAAVRTSTDTANNLVATGATVNSPAADAIQNGMNNAKTLTDAACTNTFDMTIMALTLALPTDTAKDIAGAGFSIISVNNALSAGSAVSLNAKA